MGMMHCRGYISSANGVYKYFYTKYLLKFFGAICYVFAELFWGAICVTYLMQIFG